ncbi:hypothetical protein PENTCL1PPCAC_24821, partial [Pristionchus entomophagus]
SGVFSSRNVERSNRRTKRIDFEWNGGRRRTFTPVNGKFEIFKFSFFLILIIPERLGIRPLEQDARSFEGAIVHLLHVGTDDLQESDERPVSLVPLSQVVVLLIADPV